MVGEHGAGTSDRDTGGTAHDEGVDRAARSARDARAGRLTARPLRTAVAAAIAVAVVIAAVVGVRSLGLLSGPGNPFRERTTDRSQPVLLRSIQDLSRYVAAEGNFEVVVDLANDRKYIPDFLVNDRTLFVAAGSVQVYVEFGQMGQGAISVSDDRDTVEITLPEPRFAEPNLDNDRSYVFAQQRGLINRLGDLFDNDPNRLRELQRMAEDKIATAARDSGLAKRAQDNTRAMLTGMLRALGYSTVNIMFVTP